MNNDVYVVLSFVSMFISLLIYSIKALRHWLLSIVVLFLVVVLIVLNLFWLGCDYFTGRGVSWAVVYTLTSTLTGTAIKEILPQSLILFMLLLIALYGVFYITLKVKTKTSKNLIYNGVSFLFLTLAVIFSPLVHQLSQLIRNENKQNQVYAKDFFQYYISPKDVIDNPKYNLVYIYGESLEHVFFENELFPRLTKDIDALAVKRIDFNNTQQYSGMDFTIGGIVASQCGLPLLVPITFGSAAVNGGFFSDSICLGDILKRSGYDNYFYQGADIRFSDKIDFFKKHGFDHITGLMESGLQNNFAVQGSWGLHDDVTLSLAWEKFKKLSSEKKRFSIFTLTVDTHPPKGSIPSTCIDNDYRVNGKHIDTLSAVVCSQHAIADFINKIMTSPWADNTIVVLSSDHLATAEAAFVYDDVHNKKRSTTFFVLKQGKGVEFVSTLRNTMDNGATVLELLGGGNNIGLGRSTLSRVSLSERFKNFAEKLNAWNDYIKDRWDAVIRDNKLEVDTVKQTAIIGGHQYKLPVLIFQDGDKYIPLNNTFGLRFTLSRAEIGVKFYWIDLCYRHGNVWDKSLILSQEWCIAQGTLGGDIQLSKITGKDSPQHIIISDSLTNPKRYREDTLNLMMPSDDIHYASDYLFFGIDGIPQNVKSITGLSKREGWGRWSDSNIAPSVKISYRNKLPAQFELLIQAKAWDKNVNVPVAVNIGKQTQYLNLQKDLELYRLKFSNVDSDTIEIVPPAPEISWKDSMVGAPVDGTLRKIGVGLGTLKIEPIQN